MSWTINLVDRWGEGTDLDTNFGFMQRVFSLCPTWRLLWENFTSFANKGDIIPLDEINYVLPEIKKELSKIKDSDDDRDNTEVKEYLNKLIKFVEENYDEDSKKGLAIW